MMTNGDAYTIRESTFSATLVGVMPLLMNNPASMLAPKDTGPKAKKEIPTPEDEASAKAYRLPTGELFIPTVMVFQAMIEAGKLLNDPDNPRRRVSYKLAAALFPPAVEGFPILDGDGEPVTEYAIDVRRAVVQGNGVQRARPRVDVPWSTRVTMDFDADLLSAEALYMVLATAGKQTGIMDYRPQKRGPYGRFQVEDFQA